MKLLKSRHFWLPIIATVLYVSLRLGSQSNLPPSGANDSRTVNYSLLIHTHDSFRVLILAVIAALLVWWFSGLIRTIRLQRVRNAAKSLLLIGASVLLCGFIFVVSHLSSPVSHIDSVRVGKYVYQLMYAEPPDADGFKEISTPAYWYIYRCERSGVYCHPIYRSEQFFRDLSVAPASLGTRLEFDPTTDQIKLIEVQQFTNRVNTLYMLANASDPTSQSAS